MSPWQGSCNGTKPCISFCIGSNPKDLQKARRRGLLVSFLEGRTRVFQWNPRYPFLKEIQALAKKAYSFLPEEMQQTYYQSIIKTLNIGQNRKDLKIS